jgi:hypothetical protein
VPASVFISTVDNLLRGKHCKSKKNDIKRIWNRYFESVINEYRLMHGHFHIGLLIIPRPSYWPETESRDDNPYPFDIIFFTFAVFSSQQIINCWYENGCRHALNLRCCWSYQLLKHIIFIIISVWSQFIKKHWTDSND